MNWPQSEAFDQLGVPAQNSPDPASVFGSHWVVWFDDQLWDPSYGSGPFNAPAGLESQGLVLWEDGGPGTVAGFLRFLILEPGVDVRPVVRKNDLTTMEMKINRIFP